MADNKTPPLRPLRLRMAAAARAVGKPQFVLEKDYALSYLLAGIAAVPALRESLVFKGGTCLRKAYFPGYRHQIRRVPAPSIRAACSISTGIVSSHHRAVIVPLMAPLRHDEPPLFSCSQ